MILVEQFFQVKITNKNRKWFNDIGLLKNNDNNLITVNVLDLQIGSAQEVKFNCDYCGELDIKPYNKIIRGRKNIEKDCCSNKECRNEKRVEANLHLFGVSSSFKLTSFREQRDKTMLEKYGSLYPIQIDQFRKKIENTNLLKYGGKSPFSNTEIREKIKDSLFEKFGVKNVFQIPEVKDKIKTSITKKYGVNNVMESEEIKDKVKKTNLKRYGVQYPLKNYEIRKKAKETMSRKYGVNYAMQSKNINEKAIQTMYENGTQKLSKQQKYIANILDGVINYPVSNISLDIAFTNKSIYIEYDGGGHDLSVKLGSLTEKEFVTKEMKRYYFLREQGWKSVRIISKKDLIPSKETILEMWELSRRILDKENWIVFNIDEGIIETKYRISNYDFGKLVRF